MNTSFIKTMLLSHHLTTHKKETCSVIQNLERWYGVDMVGVLDQQLWTRDETDHDPCLGDIKRTRVWDPYEDIEVWSESLWPNEAGTRFWKVIRSDRMGNS